MRALFLSSAALITPCLALADPQCILPALPAMAAVPDTMLQQGAASPTASTGAPALDHVVAAGAQLTEAGISHGLRTVVARGEGQFMRMYVAPTGQAVVAGLMSELSVAELLAMAPGQVMELGNPHGLRGLFVRNGGQFQVFYATPDGGRVIPGSMFDARGRNLTREQIASIPGAVPTVVVGDAQSAPARPGQAVAPPAQVAAGSLLQAVEAAAYGTSGPSSAPRLYVFVDPLCGPSVRAMEQLRPHVAAGRVQLAVVPVAVLDPNNQGRSSQAAKAMLGLPRDAMVAAWGAGKLEGSAEPAAEQRLAGNMAVAAALRLRGTPTLVWRKTDGTEGRADGVPKDLDALVASVGR